MRSTRAVTALAAASAVAAGSICVFLGQGSAPLWVFPLFALTFFLAGHYTVWVPVGRQGIAFALGDAVVAVGLVVDPGSRTVLAMVAGGAVVYYLRHDTLLKLGFNVAQAALAIASAAMVTKALGGGVAAALVGLIAFVLVNYCLIGSAVSLTSGRRFSAVFHEFAQLGAVHNAGNISIGLLTGWLAVNAPFGLLGLVAPLVLLWWSYRQQAERAAEARLFAQLAEGRERLTEASADSSAHLLVQSAARLFGGAQVELLLRHPDGLIRYAGGEDGVDERSHVSPDALAQPWVLRALGTQEVTSGLDDGHPYCSAVLGERDRPVAVLIARRSARIGAFSRQEERLAEVLVAQAEAWLSVADITARRDEAVDRARANSDATKALGDVGAYTAPSLVILRESANRLHRLAYSFTGDDPIRDIVDELHAVERAVASLLGAVALASEGAPTSEFAALEGEMARSDALRGPQRAEWTTTGRLDSSDAV